MTIRKQALAGAIFVLVLATVLASPILQAGDQTPVSRFDVDPFLEAVMEQKAPEDFYLHEKLSGGGSLTTASLNRAVRESREIGRQTADAAPKVSKAAWRFVGPSNIGARVTDIAVDVELEDTLYVASATGGVWKSSDAGKTFKPIWKKGRVQSIGAIVMASDGTLYVGTGEANPGGGSITYGGNGVWKSTNRGKTWTHVGLTKSPRIGRLAVDPKDPDHVYAAVTGNLFKPGGERGLYETKDGGRSWKRILEGDNDTTGAVDVAIDPKNPKNLLVTMWDHIRYPDVRYYSGEGSGVYRSSDGGKTFERLGPVNGLPPPSEEVGRIGVTFDPQNPDRAYAIYANNSKGAFLAWYISDDGGATWVQPPGSASLAQSQSVYGWWFARVWVDPKDSNHVFVAGLPLAESTDGGMSFPTMQQEQHVDHHALAWDPHKEGRVYNGNDGGVYRSEENGADGSWVHGEYQPWSQFFTIDVSEQDPSLMNGGLQDQGSIRSWGGSNWNNYYGGDGVKNTINPNDKLNVFACSQYGACGRSEDGGETMDDFDTRTVSSRKGWLTPIEFQPGNTDVVYYAGDVINRSPDKGATWEPISPDLGEGDPGRESNPLYAAHYGTVQAIGLNKAKPEVIYAGTDNGKVWKTTDDGGAWTKIGVDDLPNKWVSHIQVKPNNPNVVYLTYSGFREGDHRPYVFKSKNGGEKWRSISANLPKAPVNDIVLVGRKLYAATDVGVFVSGTKRFKWLKLGKGLPLAPVNDLRYIPVNKTLYAGTFGRGIYAVKPPAR